MDKYRKELIDEINNAPKILKDYIHSLDSFQYSEVIIELFAAERKLETALAFINDAESRINKIKPVASIQQQASANDGKYLLNREEV